MCISRTLVSACLLLTAASALNLGLYKNERCTGEVAKRTDSKPSDGCQSAIFANFGAIMNSWEKDDDNDFMFVSYSDDNCCHQAMVEQISWDDLVCQPVKGARSYRIVNVTDPDMGKDDEIYACEDPDVQLQVQDLHELADEELADDELDYPIREEAAAEAESAAEA